MAALTTLLRKLVGKPATKVGRPATRRTRLSVLDLETRVVPYATGLDMGQYGNYGAIQGYLSTGSLYDGWGGGVLNPGYSPYASYPGNPFVPPGFNLGSPSQLLQPVPMAGYSSQQIENYLLNSSPFRGGMYPTGSYGGGYSYPVAYPPYGFGTYQSPYQNVNLPAWQNPTGYGVSAGGVITPGFGVSGSGYGIRYW
jgi:hypothetical protein